MSFKITPLMILLYQVVNYFIICFAYPYFVASDSYIGFVYFFCLVTNLCAFIGVVIINQFLLKPYIKHQLLYLMLFFVTLLLVNQLVYLLLSCGLPIFDLNDSHQDYNKGENLLLTLSPLISAMLVFGGSLLRIKK